jgi:hypothetical protein
MKTINRLIWMLIGFSLVLAACSSTGEEESPTPQPESVLTAAAQTAQVQLTELAKPQDTSTSPSQPLETLPGNTPTSSSATNISPAPAETATQTPTAVTGGFDQAEFWSDVTIPDGTDFDPGTGFTKVWRLRNSGTNTWTPGYAIAFFGGAQMSGPAEVPLTGNVSPGDTVDVSVDLVAPDSGGTYQGFWKMRNAAGEFFDYAVFVQIDVVGGGASVTVTSQPSGSGRVTDVSLKVDDASPSDCPHTFNFTGSFTLNEPATVTYRLEAGSDTPGFVFDLPGELTRSFDAGTNSVIYTLDIQDTVNGWAQIHILEPNDVVSDQVAFSLSCGP